MSYSAAKSGKTSAKGAYQSKNPKQIHQKEMMNRTYKLFTGKKFLKFKHQFPRMNETEIVNKVLREWRQLSLEDKLKLQQTYANELVSGSDDDSSFQKDSENIKKQKNDILMNQEDKKEQNKNGQENMIILEIPTNEKQPKSQEEQQNQESLKFPFDQKPKIAKSEDQDDNCVSGMINSESLSPIGKPKKEKVKKIKKQRNYSKLKNGQYVIFYKHYYQRLKKEHPKWSPDQITHIVKLLWRKKTQKTKTSQIRKAQKQQDIKNKVRKVRKTPLTGKELFIKNKKLSSKIGQRSQIDKLWRCLPKQSKNYWAKTAEKLNSRENQNQENGQNLMRNSKVISSRCLLLKGRGKSTERKHFEQIRQQKLQNTSKKIKLQHSNQRIKQQGEQVFEERKTSDVNEVVSLQVNPFSFLMKKIGPNNKVKAQ